MYGVFEPQKRAMSIEEEEYTRYESGRCVALYDGKPSDLLLPMLDECIFNADWTKAFISPFTLILIKKDCRQMLITQHLFGSGKGLYLCKRSGIIYFSSSLRRLKKLTGMPFKLNVPMLPHYFYNGFLAGRHTLIEGVQKLEAGTYAVIDENGIHKGALSFAFDDTANSPEQQYQSALESSIYDVVNDIEGDISVALSGGYDSNCILHSIKKNWRNKKVNAFSIGGARGVDETKTAAKIAEFYDDVSFKTAFVTPDTLRSLDEIVSILEGAVYERGIFLQYELAKLLKANSISNLICGECADQVFHQNTYNAIPENTFLYGYMDTPCQMAAYTVLPKNRTMMSAFGVDARYPFLTPQMLDSGYKTRFLNGKTKEFHKAQCKKILPKEVLDLITKQGGSTNLDSLFPEGYECSKELEKCKYYSSDFMLTGKYDHDEAVRDYYLSLLYLESFEKQFCDE